MQITPSADAAPVAPEYAAPVAPEYAAPVAPESGLEGGEVPNFSAASESYLSPQNECSSPANSSGPVANRVAMTAMAMLGHEAQGRFPPDGLKCARQASTILKRAGVSITGSDSVVGLVKQLRDAGWCNSSRPIPGAVAYANNEFGNGPRSHIGVVSYTALKLGNKVSLGMTDSLKSKFAYSDPQTNQTRQLTIYHNSTRWIVGHPQGRQDREWFSKVKFLVPPESCAGVAK